MECETPRLFHHGQAFLDYFDPIEQESLLLLI